MALQTRNLVMLGLGIQNDQPPNSLQPQLPDGIHLRWAFQSELGFPWYGFYLFRKLHRPGNRRCISDELRNQNLSPGTTDRTSLFLGNVFVRKDVRSGNTSAQTLRFTDQFPQSSVVELDLSDFVGSLRLPFDLQFQFSPSPVCSVEVVLGFTASAPTTITITALFGNTAVAQTQASGSAGVIASVRLTADAINQIRVSSGAAVLIDLCYIHLADEVRNGDWAPVPGFPQPLCLPLSHPGYPCHSGPENFGRAWIEGRGRKHFGDALCDNPPLYDIGVIFIMAGSAVVIGSGTNWTSDLVGAAIQIVGDPGIYIIAAVLGPAKLLLDRPYAGTTRSNVPYSIRQDDFAELYDDLISLVEGGPAAGPMFNRSRPKAEPTSGTIALNSGSDQVIGTGTNWNDRLVGLALIVAHDAPGTVSMSISEPTILEGSGTNWDAGLAGMTLQLAGDPSLFIDESVISPDRLALNRNYVGPRVTNQTYQLFDYDTYTIQAVRSPTELQLNRPYARDGASGRAYRIFAPYRDEDTDPELEGPAMYRQYPLDTVLLASLDPGIAQMLGLYWIDMQVAPGVAYDYLLVADYNGVAGLNAAKALDVMRAGNFSTIEAALVCNKRREPATALAPPSDLRVFALPGSITAPDKGSVSLSWDLGLTTADVLLPDRPVLYHLWRAGLGATRPASAPPAGSYQPITGDRPLLVVKPELAAGETPQFASDWPPPQVSWPFGPLVFDHGLAEGWYSYQVSGVDIFGRHSSNSAAAQWYQWAPAPSPRPWYYQDPAGTRSIDPFAVRLLDKIAPPPPAGIEAEALDPQDPTLLRDAAYQGWYNALPPNQKNIVGLRVRWRWTDRHMAQAPDIREFRIYLHPGAQLPGSDHTVAANWQERLFVVGYADQRFLKEATSSLRVYEVFLPTAGDSTLQSGLALSPSAAAPIAYAHIGVGAADDKTHTADRRTSGNLSGRTGNEGEVGAPVRLFRVHREPPTAPQLPAADAEKIFASPADYHNRSFYTYRWLPAANLKAHIFRALDDTLFQVDRARRPRPNLSASQLIFFPDSESDPRWTETKRQEVAQELNRLNEFGPAQTAQAMAYYRNLSNDGLRVLAGLEGNERAFTQLTVTPLDPDDPANADRRGPDSPEGYPVDGNPALRAYIDTLDGRATSRYFYRMAYVDGANNRSPFSLAGPPIYLPDVVPPRAPAITRALGGEGQVTLAWASNREPDLAEYRVYRADSQEAARDLRSMALVHTQAVPVGDPLARPAELSWSNTDLLGGVSYHYRLVAVDTAGNVSLPSGSLSIAVVDTRIPEPPIWTSLSWVVLQETDGAELPWPADGVIGPGLRPAIRLEWTSQLSGAIFMVSRAVRDGQSWKVVADQDAYQALRATSYLFYDTGVIPTQIYQYRIRTTSPAGITSSFFRVVEVLLPGI